MNDIVVRLSPAAHVFVRPGPALQFGVDATRAGVIDGIDEEHMSGILRTLLRARTDITWSELSRSLVEAGLPLWPKPCWKNSSIIVCYDPPQQAHRMCMCSGIRP